MRKLILSLFLLLYSTTTSVAFYAINRNIVYEDCEDSFEQSTYTNPCTKTVEYDESCERKDWCAERTIPYIDIYPNNEHPGYDYIQTCTTETFTTGDPCKVKCTMNCHYACANDYYATNWGAQTFVGTNAHGYIYRTGGTVYNVDNPSQSTGYLPHNGYYYNYIKCEKCPTGYKCDDGNGPTNCADGYKWSYDSNNQRVCTKCKDVEMCADGMVTGCNDTGTVGYYVENGTCKTCPVGYYCPGGGTKKPCSAGTYNKDTGQKKCLECPAGNYCLEGSFKPTKCPAGRYCDAGESKATGTGPVSAGYYSTGGGTSATPTKAGDGCLDGSDCGVIAPGYFATGCGTAKEPNTNGNCNTTVYYSGPVAPGHYSTGGGTLYSPSGPGNGCLDGYKCGAVGAGYYSTGGGTDVNGTCLNSHSCGTIAGGYYATCGAKKAQPTNSDASQCVSGCECGGVSPGYYSKGAGTSVTPTASGNGCLAGFECGPCPAGMACGWATTTPRNCNAGYYCLAATKEQPCPVGTTSNAGATDITNCFIKGGNGGTKFCINNNNCFNLPAGININLKSEN